jgi:hypothetical protein
MTLNTSQIATGQKSFTQPVGLPSVNYDNNSGTFTGFMSSSTNLTYSNLVGTFSVANSVIVGTGINSGITSATSRAGTNGGELVLTTSGTATPVTQGSVAGYLTDQQITINNVNRNIFVFDDVNNITQKTNNLYVTALRWNTTSSVTTPIYTDDFVEYKNYTNTPINSVIFESNSATSIQPNNTGRKGFIYDSTTFIHNTQVPTGSVSSIPVGDFLEGTGLIAPCKIAGINLISNSISYSLSSQNTITPTSTIRNTFSGYIDNTQTIYYSSNSVFLLGNYQSFVKGLCSPTTMIVTASLNDKSINIDNNSVISSPDYTKVGYIQDANTIIIEDTSNLQVGQFVKDSNITLGKHYITATNNKVFTLADATISVPTPTSHFGYLYSNRKFCNTSIRYRYT